MARFKSPSGGRTSPSNDGPENVRSDAHREGNTSSRGGASAGTEFIRLNKYIARAGVCSRRKADDLISQARVKVNGEIVTELGTRVAESDEVVVNGRSISPRRHVYILLHKPKNTITTTDDPQDRDTVMELIALSEREKSGLFPVGRLDRETTGVLLVTNDGDLAHRLMHPGYEVEKLYRVRTKKSVKPHQLDELLRGVMLDDGMAAADRVAYIAPPDHREIGVSIHEGRNRQIRRMFETIGHSIAALERVNYAGLTTEGVRPGKWRRLTDHEVRQLRRQVKLN